MASKPLLLANPPVKTKIANTLSHRVYLYNRKSNTIERITIETYNRILEHINPKSCNTLINHISNSSKIIEYNYLDLNGNIVRTLLDKDDFKSNIVVLEPTALRDTLYGL